MIAAFRETALIPVFYHDDLEICKRVMATCYKAGLRVFEFTNRGHHALSNFTALKRMADEEMPGMLLGIGTIKDEGQAKIFVDKGADFMVSPVAEPAVALYCSQQQLFYIPGCMTPTEIQQSVNNGAVLVKLFPGNILGPDFVKAVTLLFTGTLFMPTGGVGIDEKNLAAWFNAGVVCVGMGSKLFTDEIMDKKNWDELYAQIISVKEMIEKLRIK